MWFDLKRWDTVDEMLAELSPRDLVWARAAYETIPLDDGWRQADTIAGAFHDEMERYMAGKAGKSRIDKERLHKPGQYIPKLRIKKRVEVKVNQSSIDTYQAMIEQQHRN